MKITHTIGEITSYLEEFAPLSSQESYDNSGLIVGDPTAVVNAALLTLDCTEEVVDEAISIGAKLIIAHHPIIFSGLKRLNGKNYVERTVIKAIKNNIAIYAIHTNLDNYRFGVNFEIGKRLNLERLSILSAASNTLSKLIVFCPKDNCGNVSEALFNAGAGSIGNYDRCSFESTGTGSFRPNQNSKPFIGSPEKQENVEENKIEVIVSKHKLTNVLQAMQSAHPYEEIAYDVLPLINNNEFEGAGMIGELPEALPTLDYLRKIKEAFNCSVIRHTKIVKPTLKKVAYCGGSGSFLLGAAKAKKADIFITGDYKYHEFFDAEATILIADIGHYESEQYTPNLLHGVLKKNFVNFAIHLSKVNTNPINYF